jgi:molecular chaperone GrpE
MNRKTRAEERIEALDPSPEALAAAQVEAVRAERDETVAVLEAERDEFLAALQRERAEFTNFRRRTADERHQERGLAGEDLIRKTLALADDFDRAIETRPPDLADNAWVEGIAAIDRKLRMLLESEGVIAVEAAPGTPFDPRLHEAIVSVPGTGRAEGEIVEEVRRGYRVRDRLIRPALVAVAAAPDPALDPAPDPAPGPAPDPELAAAPDPAPGPAPDPTAGPRPGLVN